MAGDRISTRMRAAPSCLALACLVVGVPVPAGAAGGAGTTPGGEVAPAVQANGASLAPSISGDGRFVVFGSNSTNLVAGDTNGVIDVFVRDRQQRTTRRVSVGTGGAQANGASPDSPVISADGRFGVFGSDASNLVAGDTNGVRDLFVRDLVQATTRRISVSTAGVQANAPVLSYSVSATGRFVAFVSLASNLVPGDTNGAFDVFVRDQQDGSTRRVSASSTGQQANGESYGGPSVSADGRYVAFGSAASNLVAGDTNGAFDVFVRDRTKNVVRRVSVTGSGAQANGGLGGPVTISADGRYVAFESDATNLVGGDTNGVEDVFVRDLVRATTRRVNVGSGGQQADGFTYNPPAISPDGRLVGFTSMATNLVTPAGNLREDVFLRDVVLARTSRLTLTPGGRPGNGEYSNTGAQFISADRRYATFSSDSSDLVPDDTNGQNDVFVRDLANGTTQRVSVSGPG